MPVQPQILVVDDDEEIGMMIKMILDYRGFSTMVLQRSDHVEETIGLHPIKLVILDMLIAGVKGTEVCMRLKQNAATSSLPILMITALHEAELVCKQAGADDFLPKPFEMDGLVEKVKKYVTVPQT